MSRHVTHPRLHQAARLARDYWTTAGVAVVVAHWFVTGQRPPTAAGVIGIVVAAWCAGYLTTDARVRRRRNHALAVAQDTIATLEADLAESRIEFVALHAAYLAAIGKGRK